MDLIRVGDRVINLDYLVGMHVERLHDGSVLRVTLDMAGAVKYTFFGNATEHALFIEQLINWIQDQAKDISNGVPSKEM